jgi:mannobiose 2-epimerase
MNTDLKQSFRTMRSEVEHELTSNILPFWMDKMMDRERGGFYGRIDGQQQLHADAEKGAILHARILWTFSSAYRILRKPEYLETATHAKRFLIDRFYDPEYGGIYWSLNADGTPLDTKKQFYAIGFAIYGLSEYARATGDKEALDYAIRLYHSIEEHSFDPVHNGYFEATTRDWQEIADMRLSEKDANERKTMNTHLHILEPYTNLYRVWKDAGLRRQLRNLILVFIDTILDSKTGHLRLFFDDNWHSKSPIISYGHDIEASWLIHEAALELGDAELLAEVERVALHIGDAAAEGLQRDGGMNYECNPVEGTVDKDRHWWVQAETVVGYTNLYQHFHNEEAGQRALNAWAFIQQHIIDREHGEWVWSLKADGTQNRTDDKAGFWKCPYHNGRMCMEIMEREI